MLATQLLPSFYILEIEGTAVESVIPGNFGIAKIVIGSRDFTNDLSAISALSTTMINLTAHMDLNGDDVKEQVDYNPEFFPTIPALESDEETHSMTAEDFKNIEEGKVEESVTLQLTKNFDPIGDFVEARWTVKSAEFLIRGKIVVNPDKYMQQKASELSIPYPITSDKRVHIH